MGKKVTLNEQELKKIIHECVESALNEIFGPKPGQIAARYKTGFQNFGTPQKNVVLNAANKTAAVACGAYGGATGNQGALNKATEYNEKIRQRNAEYNAKVEKNRQNIMAKRANRLQAMANAARAQASPAPQQPAAPVQSRGVRIQPRTPINQ